jgi:hypothetical protein
MSSNFRKVCFPKLSSSAYVLLWVTIALHLFTVFVAVRVGGWLEGGLSFVFPAAAQVYWILELWQTTGHFFHFLTIACIAYLGLWVAVVWTGWRRNPVPHG